MALIVALMLVMLCGFAALAVDVGNLYRVRQQTRVALDAAALAGAFELNGTTAQVIVAQNKAIAQALLHRVNGAYLQLTAAEVTIGSWKAGSGFNKDETDDTKKNAVQITHQTPAVTNPFGGVLGFPTGPVGATATAVGGGPTSSPCTFPLVAAQCKIQAGMQADGSCNYCMSFQNSTSDTAGFTAFTAGNSVSPQDIYDSIATACTDGAKKPVVNADGSCNANCSPNAVTQNTAITLNNGNPFNTGKGKNNPCGLLQDILNRDGTTPKAFKVTVPVIDNGGPACNPDFSRSDKPQPSGFAEMTIYGVKCGTADKTGVFAADAPLNSKACPAPTDSKGNPSDKYILATLECQSRINAPGGGGFFGLRARPRLVPNLPLP